MSIRIFLLFTLLLTSCAAAPERADLARLQQEVADTERAFARTMADRDFRGFQSYLADETIFFGSKGPLRGKEVVSAKWKGFYAGAQAPFSWKPETAEVLDSGTLALTSGPVHDPGGKLIGTFTSIWRREADGRWRIVFDKGCDVCEPCPRK